MQCLQNTEWSGTIFNPASVIWCHDSTGFVAYVGRSVLLKVKIAECTKNDPAHISSFRRESRVRSKPPLGCSARNIDAVAYVETEA
jgi:hypothetical protein